MENMKFIRLTVSSVVFVVLMSSCSKHPFNPLAEDMADKWDDIWNIAQKYEGVNTKALIMEKMNIENDDKEKVRRYGKEFEELLRKESKEMEGKEVKVEIISNFKGWVINKPWIIERIDPFIPKITIKGDMEVVANNNDERELYLVAYAGKEPVCVFRTVGPIVIDRELVDGKPAVGTILTFTECSPEIHFYQWRKIAAINKLIWIFEDSDDFRKADLALKKDLEFENRWHKIKIE
jgi:hypothetical protein